MKSAHPTSPLPTEQHEAQRLYDECRSTNALARRVGTSKTFIRLWAKSVGVKLRGRGGTNNPGGKRGKRGGSQRTAIKGVTLHECAEYRRPCVIHDLGECDACRRQHSIHTATGGGVSSSWAAMESGYAQSMFDFRKPINHR